MNSDSNEIRYAEFLQEGVLTIPTIRCDITNIKINDIVYLSIGKPPNKKDLYCKISKINKSYITVSDLYTKIENNKVVFYFDIKNTISSSSNSQFNLANKEIFLFDRKLYKFNDNIIINEDDDEDEEKYEKLLKDRLNKLIALTGNSIEDVDEDISYIYLLQEREFYQSNKNVYKFGKTQQKADNRIRRFTEYKRGSKILLLMECHNDSLIDIELKIRKEFEKNFKQHIDGHEHFEGDCRKMIDIIYDTIIKNNKFKEDNIFVIKVKEDNNTDVKQEKKEEKLEVKEDVKLEVKEDNNIDVKQEKKEEKIEGKQNKRINVKKSKIKKCKIDNKEEKISNYTKLLERVYTLINNKKKIISSNNKEAIKIESGDKDDSRYVFMKALGISFYRGSVEKTFEEIRNQCFKNNIQLYLDIELEDKTIVPIEITGNNKLKELIV